MDRRRVEPAHDDVRVERPGDPVGAYRAYYATEKAPWARWNHTERPPWLEDEEYVLE